MKKLLIIMMTLLLAAGAFATTISDIQQGNVSEGTVVTVSGIVTGEPYAFGGSKMYIQDGEGAWSGIYVYLGTHVENLVGDSVIVAEGDSVTVTGEYAEYFDLSQLKNITSLVVDEAGVGCPAPIMVPADSLNQEKYEGCLVKLNKVAVSDGKNGFGEWDVADASGSVAVDDEGNAAYYFWPDEYDSLISITGLMSFSYGEYKIQPRLAWDIIEGPLSGETKIYTRIQRIQQVRGSDLMKTPIDGVSDINYINDPDTTLYVKGVVTYPTGLGYAGDGVKFIMTDLHGGPWSAVLSYNADASLYPDMYAGDVMEMGGYVGEYTTGSGSNMTEFWLVGDANLLEIIELPDTSVITTGDLRHPITAEQWENNTVRIENALVVGNSYQYEILGIDDGSGLALVDDDSDSLEGYVAPPIMTPIESITGWVYNSYGSFLDSSTYKLNPLYKEDIVLGEGPAMLMNPARTPAGIPTSTQSVAARILVSTVRTIDTAKVFYKVNDGALSSVEMTEGSGNIWTGVIPAQADDAIVEYYFYVVDDSSDVSALPSNYDEGNYFTYKVLDGDVSVYDIQYTHAATGLSPLNGCNVTFDAYLTADAADMVTFKNSAGKFAIPVADALGAWNGVWVLASSADLASLVEGDLVTVSGKVDDNHEAYWAYELNTYVDATVTLKINEVPIGKTSVTLAELEANPEAYEGVLVELSSPLEIESVNSYDLTLTDGTNSFLLDDDCVADSTFDINYQSDVVVGGIDTLIAGNTFDAISGVVLYSYGSVKIEVRKASDITVGEVSISEEVPSNYALHQNYPNPFNPVTTIRFELANASNVKLTIFDINGRLVEELVNTSMNAGAYDLRWDAAHLASGMYLYRLETPEFTATNKLVLLK